MSQFLGWPLRWEPLCETTWNTFTSICLADSFSAFVSDLSFSVPLECSISAYYNMVSRYRSPVEWVWRRTSAVLCHPGISGLDCRGLLGASAWSTSSHKHNPEDFRTEGAWENTSTWAAREKLAVFGLSRPTVSRTPTGTTSWSSEMFSMTVSTGCCLWDFWNEKAKWCQSKQGQHACVRQWNNHRGCLKCSLTRIQVSCCCKMHLMI